MVVHGRTYASEQAGMHQAAAPDSEVLPEDFAIPETPKAANPYGANNKVAFQKGWVRLDGAFTADQLVAFAGPFEEREEVVRGRRDRVMGVMSPIRGQAAEAVKGILERDPKSIGGHRVTPRAGTPESKSAAPESAIGLGRACGARWLAPSGAAGRRLHIQDLALPFLLDPGVVVSLQARRSTRSRRRRRLHEHVPAIHGTSWLASSLAIVQRRRSALVRTASRARFSAR